MKTQLENLCSTIDMFMAGQGFATRVAGGYVAGDGLLLSLTDLTFLNTQARLKLKETLHVKEVLSTVGVVLVNGWLGSLRPFLPADDVLEGEFTAVPFTSAEAVETVDLFELMAVHEAELEGGEGRVESGDGTRSTLHGLPLN